MQVAELMTPSPVVVAPETPVGEVARLMLDDGYRALPVVEDGRLVGIVTDGDLIAKHAQPHFPLYLQILEATIYLQSPKPFEEELRRAAGQTAREVMSDRVVTVEVDADVTVAATRMFDGGFTTLPVLRRGQLVGVVTRRDLLRLLVLEDQGQVRG